MKYSLLTIFSFFICFQIFSQTKIKEIGIQFANIDFYGTQTGKYFIHKGWNYPATQFNSRLYWKPAFQINYGQSIRKKVLLKTNIIFGKISSPTLKKDTNFINEIRSNKKSNNILFNIDEKINYQFYNSKKHNFSPYLITGISGLISKTNFSLNIPFGIGANFAINKNWYFNYESNYHLPIYNSKASWLNHSIGFIYQLNYHQKDKKKEIEIADLQNEKATFILLDQDNDGILDSLDLCPTLAGKKINHGCPDSDGDGIFDNEDKCPNEIGLQLLLGCPDADNDGVADNEDKCPNEKGLIENSGCPAVNKNDLEEINHAAQGITFESKKAILNDSSFSKLDIILSILKNESSYKIEIEGHTDNTGDENKNIELSQMRADVCKNYFVEKGIDEDRISSVGFGSMKPIADNNTEEGKAKNRRTEFILTR